MPSEVKRGKLFELSLMRLLIPKVEVNVCNVRSVEQSIRKAERGLAGYFETTAVVLMHKEDMKKIGVKSGDKVKVSSNYGAVIVKVYETDETKPGLVLMPNGPWFNTISGGDIQVTWGEHYYLVRATVEATSKEETKLEDIERDLFGEGGK
ncbi:MAG: molybdopterin dinucleotide binding domain-containing protein [Candidatus Jordarchaeales archaeon]